ncbi:hypothetical protein [Ferruginibacter albus]|uniref:hypothetical protein n=1 Tax=Ferruginibacter albus TaxID=2875540 RepID=UPI001CC4EC73|nr:hypothetical protein [Ferruginibacter albus]UAY53574.1 hypothetical protein K9M53_07880 [Ferruginibacter albus]
MRLLKNFSLLRFFIWVILIGGLTIFSFLATFGKGEGTIGDSFFLNFIADAFYLFRFPMHVLFTECMNENAFFIGLFINVIFYAFLIEATISIRKNKRIDSPISSNP